MDQKIDDIISRLLGSLPASLHDSAQGLRRDIEDNFRAVLQANLTKLDLLSRDEFLAQAKVLERTRAQLDELERRLAALEAKSSKRLKGEKVNCLTKSEKPVCLHYQVIVFKKFRGFRLLYLTIQDF